MKLLQFLPVLLLAGGGALAAGSALAPVVIRADAHDPAAWRRLDAAEAARFELGHAVFNTSWLAAGEGGGQRDGLGPQFNSQSCDSCHNSRRRGRGPVMDGPGSADFVLQVGQLRADGSFVRSHPRFGHILNTSAIDGYTAEARVSIQYQPLAHRYPDGSSLILWRPEYRVETADGSPLPQDLLLMPRMGSQVLGAGLLEQIPEAAILAGASRRTPPRGLPSWVATDAGRRLGRFGWQATQPDIAGQTAAAFANEMGLSNPLIGNDDCAASDLACRGAAQGGRPEVSRELFDAVVAFQQLEALRRTPEAAQRLRKNSEGAGLFAASGCVDCHRQRMPTRGAGSIALYTDLLLHDMGEALADRDIHGRPVPSRWRTAPLWGMSTALEGGRAVRLLHDGRARSVEQAILWHGGAAAAARERYRHLPAKSRQQLLGFVSSL